jgi:hypothetical protein
MGHEEHPAREGKRSKAHNLLVRLERYEPDVLRFAHDFRVPFGNNLRSYITTARKHGLDARDVLARLAAGQPWLPAPAPT